MKNNLPIFLICLILICCFGTAYGNEPPVVSNVQAEQRAGTNLVDITYDLQDGDGDLLLVRALITDNGVNTNAKTFTGEIGFNIEPGNNKAIIWNAGSDYLDHYGENSVVKIEAYDATSDGFNFSEPFILDTRIDKPPVDGWQIITTTDSTYNENILIDNFGKVWCFYLRSRGSHQPIYMKVINSDGFVHKSEQIIGYGSSLLSDEHQTIRAELNKKTGDIWVVIQGNDGNSHIGYFLIFDTNGGVKKESTMIATSGQVLAPKIASDKNGVMWFCWHTDTAHSAASTGAFIRYDHEGTSLDADSLHFITKGNIFNTDLTIDNTNKIWFLYERQYDVDGYESGFRIFNDKGFFIIGDDFAPGAFPFDPRKSIYADVKNARVWILKKNLTSEINQLLGYDLTPLPVKTIGEVGLASFLRNENNRLEIVRFNQNNNFYETSEFNPTNGSQITGWSRLFNGYNAITEQVAYNPNYPTLKAYLVRTDSTTTKVKVMNVQPLTFKIEISPDSINFGNTGIDTLKNATITVYNTGTGILEIDKIESSHPSFTSTENTLSIEPQTSGQIHIQFNPTDTSFVQARLTISSNAENGDQLVYLSGKGYQRTWIISVSPDTLDFGQILKDSEERKNFVVKNLGTEPLFINKIAITDTHFTVSDSNYSFLVVAGDSHSVEVTFSPDDTALFIGKLYVYSNADSSLQIKNNLFTSNFLVNSESDTQDVVLIGRGIFYSFPKIVIEPTAIQFDTTRIGKSKTKSFKVRNIGNDVLDITRLYSTDEHFTIGQEDANFQVSPGDSHVVEVTFIPTTTSYIKALIYVNNNDSNLTIPVNGQGYTYGNPDIYVDKSSLIFDNVAIGDSSSKFLGISNIGTNTLNINAIYTTNNQFLVKLDTVTYGIDPSISPDETMFLTVTFAPTSEGTFYDTLNIESNDPDSSRYAIPLFGEAFQPKLQKIAVSPALLNFGEVKEIKYKQMYLTIKNIGELTLKIKNISNKLRQFVVSTSDSFSIAPRDSSIIGVRFYPPNEGTFQDTITVASDDPVNSELKVPLVGQGIPLSDQKITVNPENLNFGEVALGGSSTRYLWIYNTGEKILNVTNIVTSSDHYRVSHVELSINPNSYYYISVTFRPDNKVGTIEAQLTITSDDPKNKTFNVSLTGIGRSLNPAFIATNVGTIDFGSVALFHSSSQYIKVYNNGEQNLSVTDIAISDSQFTANPKQFTIYPGSYRWVYVTFKPTGLGSINKQLMIQSNAANGDLVVRVKGSGRALTPPDIYVSRESYKFGEVPISKQASFYLEITNRGEEALNVDITHSDTTYFTLSTTHFSLNSGKKQYVLIIFSPVAVKSYSDTLKIMSNDPDNRIKYVYLSGRGRLLYDQNIAVYPGNLDFGAVGEGRSKTLPLWIKNEGEKELEIHSILTDLPEFSVENTAFILKQNEGRNVNVTFRPTKNKAFSANLLIQSNDPDSASYKIALKGSGRKLQPIIVVEPDSMSFGSVAVGDSLIKPLYIYNQGEIALWITSINRSDRENFWINADSFAVDPGRWGTINIKFKPIQKDTFSATLTIDNSDPTNEHIMIPIYGIGRDSLRQKIVAIPDTLYFGSVAIGHEIKKEVTVRNLGEKLLKVTKVRCDNEFFNVDSTGFEVGKGASHPLVVTFAPKKIDAFHAKLTIENNDTTIQIGMFGMGREIKSPEITTNTDTLNFGSVLLNSSAVLGFYINNLGDMPLKIYGIQSSDKQFSVTTDSFSVNSRSEQWIAVSFKPQTLDPTYAFLTIQSNDPKTATKIIYLIGSGREASLPRIALSANQIDFGAVKKGVMYNRSFWISNIGEDTLVVSKIISHDTLFYVNDKSFSLLRNEYRRIYVYFNAAKVDTFNKAFTTDLIIINNDPLSDSTKVKLSAKITAPAEPQIAVVPDSLDFGRQPINKKNALWLMVKNLGDQLLEITNIVSSNRQFTVGTTRFSIGSNSNYQLPVYFEPIAVDTVTAFLTIVSNDTTHDSLKVKLRGIGRESLPQKIALSTTKLDFGTTVISREVSRSFFITNKGEQNLYIKEITIPKAFADQFKLSENWLLLQAYATKQIIVTYRPTKKNNIRIDLQITSNDPDSSHKYIPISATCIEYHGPQISLQPKTLNFGQLILGGSKTLSFEIKNQDDDSTLTVNKISIVDTAFSKQFSISPQSFNLRPGNSKNVYVTFHPTSANIFNTILNVSHNDKYGDSIISLYGKGIQDVPGTNVLTSLSGWYGNGYYPFSSILNNGPDHAWFLKDFYIYSRPDSAKLFIAFNDSIDFFMNGSRVKSQRSDTLKHWNINGIRVDSYLNMGRNRAAAYVFNESGPGGFDCVLILYYKGVQNLIIRSGQAYPGHVESQWWYYSASGNIVTAPLMHENHRWYSYEFGWTGIDSVVANWDFEPGIGTILNDNSRYGRQIILTNVKWISGIIGSALEFKGKKNSYLKFESNIEGIPKTMQLWFNCYGTTGHHQYLFSNARPGYNGINTYLDEKLRLWIVYYGDKFSTNIIKANRWYFFSAQYTHDSIRIYINNKLIKTFTIDSTDVPMGAGYTYIGGNPELTDSTGFWGALDELTVLNTATGIPFMPNVTSIAYHEETTGAKGSSLNLNFEVYPAPFELVQGKLEYALGGSSSFENVTINSSDSVGSQFTVAIPKKHVTVRGLKFKLNLKTNYGDINYPGGIDGDSLTWIPVRTSGENATVNLDTTYRMISIPYSLDDNLVDKIFQDDLGPYSPYDWRLFQWKDTSYVEFSDSTWNDQVGLQRGRAVWLVTGENKTFDADSGWSAMDMESYRIELPNGWNQIANPFPYPVAWNDVIATSLIKPHIYYWDPDSADYVIDDTNMVLKPWEGYFVKNNEVGPFSLFVPPIAANNLLLSKRQLLAEQYQAKYENMEILITAKAYAGRYRDSHNIMGVLEGAHQEWDHFDVAEAPRIGDHIGLWITNKDWKLHPGNYAVDFRNCGENGYIWELDACTNFFRVEDQYHLQIQSELPLPEDWEIYLFDLDFDVAINLEKQNEYAFNITPEKLTTRKFKVIVGTQEFINQNNDDIPLVPMNFQLFQNYPNPFNPTTTISFNLSKRVSVQIYIYNILGQRVKVLVDQVMRGGNHHVVWDGRNDFGDMVTSGLYFVLLKAEGKTATRKMMIIK